MLSLGVDCGTSKVAVAVVDQAGAAVHSGSMLHHAQRPGAPGRFEQDGELICRTATRLVRDVPEPIRQQVAAIGLTGQMHGVILHDDALQARSALITWQDRRTLEDPAFLPSLRHPRALHAGYGIATLSWLARRGELPGEVMAATIHGFIAARWCEAGRSCIDPTDAQAWGGLLAVSDVPAGILPTCVDHGAKIGELSRQAAGELGLGAGIPIAAPLGDNQASLRATLVDPASELAFTVGTGCQLSAVVPRGALSSYGTSDLRPFDARHDVLVAAPLCGGAAWLWLAERAISWIEDLGLPAPTLDEALGRLDRLGLAADDRLVMRPHLAGERHDPRLTGSLSGLTLDNGRIGEIARALARGIAATAREMLPAAAWHGRIRLMASGNALRRSALLRTMAEAELGLPLVLREPCEEAAIGAALVARALIEAAAQQGV